MSESARMGLGTRWDPVDDRGRDGMAEPPTDALPGVGRPEGRGLAGEAAMPPEYIGKLVCGC